MNKLAVVALGGNALLRGDQAGTIEEQEQNTTETLENLVFLIREKYNIVITHGNGPQVGNILMQNAAGEEIYGIEKEVVTLITMVQVDRDDPAFDDPRKRIGKIYNKQESDQLEKERGWLFREEVKQADGWRRVVPSPKPLKISNEKVIEKTARQGTIVIATGGGGIPVYLDETGDIRPAEAVIDKDFASSLMAARIGADEFYILTDVPYVYLDYKKETERIVEFLDHRDTMKYLEDGQFSEGSMRPKIMACLQFIEQGGSKSVITEATMLEDRKYGTKITMEYED